MSTADLLFRMAGSIGLIWMIVNIVIICNYSPVDCPRWMNYSVVGMTVVALGIILSVAFGAIWGCPFLLGKL